MAIYILPRILLPHFYQHSHKRFNVLLKVYYRQYLQLLIQLIFTLTCP